jgi:adhesin transport system membrane fusion protein
MLNISKSRVNDKIKEEDYQSLRSFTFSQRKKKRYLFGTVVFILLVILFLPWTQNIISRGYVTSLYPEQRPQAIVSLISGRIDGWYVREGQFVKKGDTIMNISEIKDEYFDPQLLSRTEEQIMAKESAVQSYMEKVKAMDAQIDALNQNLKLKLEQARNKLKQSKLKVTADSIDLTAAQTNYNIAVAQLDRMETLYEQGLKSKTELEARRSKLQENQAKLISLESKLLSSKNDVLNAAMEINSIRADFRDKLAKAESEKFATLSNMYDSEATVSKMQNQLSNYTVRQGFYYITAPQDGFITQAVRTGIGETIKEGEEILTIMPSSYQLAVEMYVQPLDLPLVDKGQHIRIQFDGWPAIVFSGWPGVSTGTFGGTVVAIDNFANKEGKYRILVAPDPGAEPWPTGLRVGAGAKTFALLKDVPIWYELWRQINGFPPDYYKTDNNPGEDLMPKEK